METADSTTGLLSGETLANGAFRATEHLLGTGAHMLYGGASREDREGLLISAAWGPEHLPIDDLRREVDYIAPGVFPLRYIGHFDVRGDDPDRNADQRNHWAMVEEVSDGDWLPRVVTAPLAPRAAAALGLSVGRILEAAASAVLLVGVRPEYIWARRDGDRVIATGLTARGRSFFSRARTRCVPGLLFTRVYVAPEVCEGRGESEESLTFTLATMIAEWATGSYPFPDSWAHGQVQSLCEGRHAPLETADPLAKLLALALKREPAHRPSFSYFLRRLALLEHQLPP